MPGKCAHTEGTETMDDLEFVKSRLKDIAYLATHGEPVGNNTHKEMVDFMGGMAQEALHRLDPTKEPRGLGSPAPNLVVVR